VGHEVDGALVGDEDVVFQADGQAFGADVDGGFDGHHPAGGEGAGGVADVVDVEAEGMPDAVHEILFEGGTVGVLGLDLFGGEQAQAEEFGLDEAFSVALPVFEEAADGEAGGGGAQ